ncbi:hypothetical protein [Aridibaculum aurantiacum]|uniref:hypothetical protein n=1 Tax=Aridibaculum aurantiacum TaxID=2810307 RepID=UPI001A958869|nr:hypothetical protein [Aridibaculum aurantiacum]
MAKAAPDQHVEFFHRDHFHQHYHRKKAKKSLSKFIDFFWETDFENLWQQYPNGFADILFPNVGYTYLINLGTPFNMQLNDDSFAMKNDGFLPRFRNISTIHSAGNRLFGIKFKVSPIIFEKKINFSEYTYIFPLSYLMPREIIHAVKQAATFDVRVQTISNYYEDVVKQYEGSLKYVDVVTSILNSEEGTNYTTPVEALAQQHSISTRTLQRYFESATSISCKQALQIMRIRKALSEFVSDPAIFDYRSFGYFDYSHFFKHAKQFLAGHKMANISSHMQLLKGNGIIDY